MSPIRQGDGTGLTQKGIAEVRKGDGTVLWSAAPDIPDSDVYLHDDWGDNKLQNRDDSGTTTYNGVTGYYRPEWTTDDGSPSASNQKLQITSGDGLYTAINLDFSQTITWTWTDVTFNGSSEQTLGLFGETGSIPISNFYNGVYPGYAVILGSDDRIRLIRIDDGNETGSILTENTLSSTTGVTISVTRSSSGDWELFEGDTSLTTVTDATHTTANYISASARSTRSGDMSVGELKVN